jgi:hypothetical protein
MKEEVDEKRRSSLIHSLKVYMDGSSDHLCRNVN